MKKMAALLLAATISLSYMPLQQVLSSGMKDTVSVKETQGEQTEGKEPEGIEKAEETPTETNAWKENGEAAKKKPETDKSPGEVLDRPQENNGQEAQTGGIKEDGTEGVLPDQEPESETNAAGTKAQSESETDASGTKAQPESAAEDAKIDRSAETALEEPDTEKNSRIGNREQENGLKAEESMRSDHESNGVIFRFSEEKDYQAFIFGAGSAAKKNIHSLFYECENISSQEKEFIVSSSNTAVLKITSEASVSLPSNGSNTYGDVEFQAVGVGYADIVFTLGNTSFAQRVYIVPDWMKPKSVKQTGYQSVTIKWPKAPGCSGYRVERADVDEENWKQAAVVTDQNKVQTELKAAFKAAYSYRVIAFVKDNIRTVSVLDIDGDGDEFSLECTVRKPKPELVSVKKSGSNSLMIKWKTMKGAIGYKVYRSTIENGTYKCVYTTKNSMKSSYKQKVKKGMTYYYKLAAIYQEGKSEYSNSLSQIIPKNGKAKSLNLNVNTDDAMVQTYYYLAGGRLHMISVQGNKGFLVYTLNSAMKVTSVKRVSLNYDSWGGFCQGTDGNFYVVVGYRNPNESRSKTVIEVIKFNSKWKKGKTAKIKGGVSNSFTGIYSPFTAGNCQMDMQGNTLYIKTARIMFKHSDGLRHQSNIAFAVNTKNMKAKTSNLTYVSHSFDQYVKFKDGSIYMLDHGDAYPRALKFLMADHYGDKEQSSKSGLLFSFQGEIGNNSTGCSVGGMEVGGKNMIVCGKAQPHNKKIKGVSGFNYQLKNNVFLAFANRKTGKTAFKWLTAYNPKTSDVKVETPRIVKLSDDRFAILYDTLQNQKSVLHYVVISDTGKKIYSKDYHNMTLGGRQPILYNGNIVWTQVTYNYGYNYMGYTRDIKINSIPAIF